MARPGISTKNTEKNTPRPEILDSQNLPPKCPKNTRKYQKKYTQNTKSTHFGYSFGLLGVFSWGSRISVPGVFFRCFVWKFQVWPSRGSVAGRGVLNLFGTFPIFSGFSRFARGLFGDFPDLSFSSFSACYQRLSAMKKVGNPPVWKPPPV